MLTSPTQHTQGSVPHTITQGKHRERENQCLWDSGSFHLAGKQASKVLALLGSPHWSEGIQCGLNSHWQAVSQLSVQSWWSHGYFCKQTSCVVQHDTAAFSLHLCFGTTACPFSRPCSASETQRFSVFSHASLSLAQWIIDATKPLEQKRLRKQRRLASVMWGVVTLFWRKKFTVLLRQIIIHTVRKRLNTKRNHPLQDRDHLAPREATAWAQVWKSLCLEFYEAEPSGWVSSLPGNYPTYWLLTGGEVSLWSFN